jgi:hypothetical protein
MLSRNRELVKWSVDRNFELKGCEFSLKVKDER